MFFPLPFLQFAFSTCEFWDVLKGKGKDDCAVTGPGYKSLRHTESFLLLRRILTSSGRTRIQN